MFKKVIQGVVVGTAMFGLVGAAQAAERHINLYGASAQYLFWNEAAGAFLLTAGGCTSVSRAQKDATNGITRGLNCTSYGGDDIYIRYSAKASFDGVEAMKGVDRYAGAAEKCTELDPGVPSGMAGYYRKMIDEGSCGAIWPAYPTMGSCSGLKCVDVTLGASDVGGTAFTQSSSGQLKGHLGGGSVNRTFSGIDDSGLTHYNPLVVPFGFFVNKSVLKDGNELENITRLMATQIFSGQAWYWNDFGGNFSSDAIVACFRHAGSGTHATIDYAIMKGNGWGWGLAETENASDPTVWFNDGSSDMMRCIDQQTGAIGYADADQGLGSFPNVKALKYQGEAASRVSIRNGIYDFWSTQWLYEDPNEPNFAVTHPVIVDLMTFAADPVNVPAGKAAWWATSSEMVYMKGTDQEYPGYVGASNPQTP